MNSVSTLRSPALVMSSVLAAIVLVVGLTTQFGFAENAAPQGDVFVPIEPVRILDTRDDLGLTGSFGSDQPRDLQITGGVPSVDGTFELPKSVSAVAINVTVVLPSDGGFLAVRPSGAEGVPKTSNLNFVAGDVVPNLVDAKLGADGAVQIWVRTGDPAGGADVLVDVVGYYTGHDHDDRYYTKDKVNAKISGVQGSIDANSKTITTVKGDLERLSATVTTVQTQISGIDDALIDLDGRVAANGEAIEALESADEPAAPTVVEINRRIVNASYTSQAIEMHPGLDLDLVCTGGTNPEVHLGWDAGASEMTVWNGTTNSPSTDTMNTIWAGDGRVGFDVHMVGLVGGFYVQADVVVVATPEGENTCSFIGTATVTTFDLPR